MIMTDVPPWLYLIDPPSQAWREKQIAKGRDPDSYMEKQLREEGIWPAQGGVEALKSELKKNVELLKDIENGTVSEEYGDFALISETMRSYVERNIVMIEFLISEAG